MKRLFRMVGLVVTGLLSIACVIDLCYDYCHPEHWNDWLRNPRWDLAGTTVTTALFVLMWLKNHRLWQPFEKPACPKMSVLNVVASLDDARRPRAGDDTSSQLKGDARGQVCEVTSEIVVFREKGSCHESIRRFP